MKTFKLKPRWLLSIATGGILLLTSCAFQPTAHRTYQKSLQSTSYDAVIVPGLPFDGNKGEWNVLMKMRVYWAVHLYQKGITKNIIFSGSSVYTPYYESKIMALYAEALGVPRKNILLDTCAEHSTENVYYSYYLGKRNGMEKIAIATDPFQSRFLHNFPKKVGIEVDFIPICFNKLKEVEQKNIKIDPNSALNPQFVSIVERESFKKRWQGTRGKNIKPVPEDVRFDTVPETALKRPVSQLLTQ